MRLRRHRLRIVEMAHFKNLAPTDVLIFRTDEMLSADHAQMQLDRLRQSLGCRVIMLGHGVKLEAYDPAEGR